MPPIRSDILLTENIKIQTVEGEHITHIEFDSRFPHLWCEKCNVQLVYASLKVPNYAEELEEIGYRCPKCDLKIAMRYKGSSRTFCNCREKEIGIKPKKKSSQNTQKTLLRF